MAFELPKDRQGWSTPVRDNPQDSGDPKKNFHSPVIIYGPDGVTPISSENRLPVEVKNDENDPLYMKLTDRRVEEVVPFKREIRKENTDSSSLLTPAGVTGAIIEHIVYGVTGTFDENEGHSLRCTLSGSRSLIDTFLDVVTHRKSVNSGNDHTTVMINPNLEQDLEAEKVIPAGRLYRVNALPGPRLRLQIRINGTFEENEGLDSEVKITWLF